MPEAFDTFGTLHAPRVVLFAGGVGGARMAQGLAAVLPPGALSVVVNIGDDECFYGLNVCPDLDTVLYTLADKVSRSQGWGIEGDGTQVVQQLGVLGAPTWMTLGDADFALHIYRSWRLGQGARLTEVMREVAVRMDVSARLLPACDTPVPTEIESGVGWLGFQDWFVRQRAQPEVRGLRYRGASETLATPEVLDAILLADVVVIAPSNPLLSILPILALKGVRESLQASQAPRIAVSPMINGKAIKGPLARMLAELGMEGENRGVAQLYAGLIDGLVIDASDHEDCAGLRHDGLSVLPAHTLIKDAAPAEALARRVLAWARELAQARRMRGGEEAA